MVICTKHIICIISVNPHNSTMIKILQLAQGILVLLIQGTHFENQCFREYSLSFLLVSELLDPFNMAEAHAPISLIILVNRLGTTIVQNSQTECCPLHMAFSFFQIKNTKNAK